MFTSVYSLSHVCVCAHECVYALRVAHVEVRRQLVRVSSLLPPSACWGFNSGSEAWREVPFFFIFPFFTSPVLDSFMSP